MKKFAVVIVLLGLIACGRKDRTVGDRIKVISTGGAITAQDYTDPGRVVILDFSADW